MQLEKKNSTDFRRDIQVEPQSIARTERSFQIISLVYPNEEKNQLKIQSSIQGLK